MPSDSHFLAFSGTTLNERLRSLIKIRVNKLHQCFGSWGSEIQILSPRPFKTMGYGLGRSPFFVVASMFFLVILTFIDLKEGVRDLLSYSLGTKMLASG